MSDSSEVATVEPGRVIIQDPSRNVSTWLTPASFEKAQQIADLMAKCGTLPVHLVNKPSDCFRIVVQAAKWGMDPFVVGECTSLVHGRMCYEGKLIAAVLRSMNAIEGRLAYDITGEGKASSIVVTGTPRGGKPVSIKGTVEGWRTTTKDKESKQVIPNAWDKDPHSMLIYRGTRQWARLYASEAIMGIYTPDEVEEDIKTVEASVVPDPGKPKRRTVAQTGDAAEALAKVEVQPGETAFVKLDAKPEVKAAPTPASATLGECEAAVKAVFFNGKTRPALGVVLRAWNLKEVNELGGAAAEDRAKFISDLNAKAAELAGAA